MNLQNKVSKRDHSFIVNHRLCCEGGCTALHYACSYHNKETVEVLLSHISLDINIQDEVSLIFVIPIICVYYFYF